VVSEASRRALADFLRRRREAIDPVSRGFPAGRRRTPGLRREEVAVLAGLSPSWYTYLEQGRDIQVSEQVVNSLARVLELDPDERRYLQLLATGRTEHRSRLPDGETRQVLQDLVDAVDPVPAYAADKRADMIAWNRAATEWFADFGAPGQPRPNMLIWMLTHPAARQRFADWEAEARDLLGRFRATSAVHPDDPRIRELTAEIDALGPPVRDWWQAHEVRGQTARIRRLRHPVLGERDMRIVASHLAGADDVGIVMHVPVAGADVRTPD
jgi:transcriptional regulator with XRE-family HTH domain